MHRLKSRIRQNMSTQKVENLSRDRDAQPTTQDLLADIELLEREQDICRDISSPRPVIGRMVMHIRRILRIALRPFLGRQVAFNAATVRLLKSLQQRFGLLVEHEILMDHLQYEVEKATRYGVELRKRFEEDLDRRLNEQNSLLSQVEQKLANLDQQAAIFFPRQDVGASANLPSTAPLVDSGFIPRQEHPWYPPFALGPSTIAERATDSETIKKVVEINRRLLPDPVIRYLSSYYDHGLTMFGSDWRFADVATVLVAIGELMKPKSYLEIGVFHGRSMSVLAAICPECALYGFDLWISDYASLDNPGPDYVREQLKRVGHVGPATFISGNSHETLPRFFAENPNLFFDVITVDGDHTYDGTAQDVCDVIPRLKVGGFLVFDDLAHPATRFLSRVWSRVVVTDPRFVCWQFTETGNGVAIAMKQYDYQ